MKIRLPHFARRATRAAIVCVATLPLWSCTTAGNDVSAGLPASDSTANMGNAQTTELTETQSAQGNTTQDPAAANPEQQAVALAVPTPSSGDAPASVEDNETQPAQAISNKEATPKGDATNVAAATPETVDPATAGDGSVATAAAAPPPAPKKTGLFAFFGSSKPRDASQLTRSRDSGGAPPSPAASRKAVAKAPGQAAIAATAGAPAELNMAALDLPSSGGDEAPATRRRAPATDDGGLPGVRQSALFEIKRRSGVDDDSDVDLYEDAPTVQLASVGGLGRGANGLLTQRDDVDVGCLKPGLVRVLKMIEAKYGRKLVVTSGYRSPSRNRKARGAKNSQHMYCAAADFQVPGVGKAELARFVRALPNRGGVGTYCHTNSIHVDVGPHRDWNWRCRGRRKG